MKWLGGITDAMNMSLDKLQEMMRDRDRDCVVNEFAKSQTRLGN